MSQVTPKPTPISAGEAHGALHSAWRRFFDAPPTQNQLALLLAQSALETGNWERMIHFNFGQLMANTEGKGVNVFWDGDYYEDPKGDGNKRVYHSAEEGAADYVRLLSHREAWRAGLLSGKPDVYAKALKSPPAYYQAPLSGYTVTLTALFRRFGGTVSSYGSVIAKLYGLAALGLGAWYITRKGRKR